MGFARGWAPQKLYLAGRAQSFTKLPCKVLGIFGNFRGGAPLPRGGHPSPGGAPHPTRAPPGMESSHRHLE